MKTGNGESAKWLIRSGRGHRNFFFDRLNQSGGDNSSGYVAFDVRFERLLPIEQGLELFVFLYFQQQIFLLIFIQLVVQKHCDTLHQILVGHN